MEDNIFRDNEGDPLTYSLTSYDDNNTIPTWLTFVAENRTLLGVPSKQNEGQTIILKLVAFDGRNGTAYQRMYLVVSPNYRVGAIVMLIVLGILPVAALFGFSIAMCFVKVPSLAEQKMAKIAEEKAKQIFQKNMEGN